MDDNLRYFIIFYVAQNKDTVAHGNYSSCRTGFPIRSECVKHIVAINGATLFKEKEVVINNIMEISKKDFFDWNINSATY